MSETKFLSTLEMQCISNETPLFRATFLAHKNVCIHKKTLAFSEHRKSLIFLCLVQEIPWISLHPKNRH